MLKMFIVLLSNIVNGSNHTKCVSLRHQKCMIQPTLINLHHNEYSQEFHYYPFAYVIIFLMTYLLKYMFQTSIIGNSVIPCDEITEEETTNF